MLTLTTLLHKSTEVLMRAEEERQVNWAGME